MAGRCHVVVLNWNGRDSIRPCLRAVLHQTYAAYRVVVVDNASTDGSRDIVRDEFPEVTLVPLPENLHFARGTNAGLREALRDPECAFIATLNNDTRVDSDWLAELVRMAGDRVGMVASKMVFIDRPNVLNSTGVSIGPDGSAMDRGWNSVDEGQFDEALDVFGPSAGAALYRKDVLDSVGLFDEDFFAYYEDLDLAWRTRFAGWEARFAPQAIVHHKYSASYGSANPMKTYLCERNRVRGGTCRWESPGIWSASWQAHSLGTAQSSNRDSRPEADSARRRRRWLGRASMRTRDSRARSRSDANEKRRPAWMSTRSGAGFAPTAFR